MQTAHVFSNGAVDDAIVRNSRFPTHTANQSDCLQVKLLPRMSRACIGSRRPCSAISTASSLRSRSSAHSSHKRNWSSSLHGRLAIDSRGACIFCQPSVSDLPWRRSNEETELDVPFYCCDYACGRELYTCTNSTESDRRHLLVESPPRWHGRRLDYLLQCEPSSAGRTHQFAQRHGSGHKSGR